MSMATRRIVVCPIMTETLPWVDCKNAYQQVILFLFCLSLAKLNGRCLSSWHFHCRFSFPLMQTIAGCDIYQFDQTLPAQHILRGYQFSHQGYWKDNNKNRIRRIQQTPTDKCGLMCCASKCSDDLGCKAFEQQSELSMSNQQLVMEGKCYLWIVTQGNPAFQLDGSMGPKNLNDKYRAFTRCKPGGSFLDRSNYRFSISLHHDYRTHKCHKMYSLCFFIMQFTPL